MRVIKFRAPFDITKDIGHFTLEELGYHDSIGVNIDLEKAEQYIGLQDKNGVDIYEGDFLRDCDSGYVSIVIYNESRAQFQFHDFRYDNYYSVSELWLPSLEIIGNIHENPEWPEWTW